MSRRTVLRPEAVKEDTLEDKDGNTKVSVENSTNEDKIRFTTAGAERMIIDETGKVGIGVASPLSPLHAYGNLNGTYIATIDNDQSNNGHVMKLLTDGNGVGSNVLDMENSGGVIFRARADGRFGFGPDGVNSMGAGTFVVGIDNSSHTSDIAISKRLQHLADPDTYMDFPSDDNIALVAGGNTKVVIESLGGNEGTIKYTLGGVEKIAFDSQGAIYGKGGTLGLASTNNKNVKSLQGTSTNTAVLQDTTFSGLGSNSFSVSFWFYQNDTNSNPISTNTRIRFLEGSTERHVLDLRYPDVAITIEPTTGGSADTENYDTNLEEQKWYHVVALFDLNLSSGSPRLWINGVEVNGTDYSAPGGVAPTISRVDVYLDDGTGMHDLIFWDKLLSDVEVNELWNQGYYFDPTTHSAVADIVSWFKLGEESDLNSFSPGNTLSGTITLLDSMNPITGGSNTFTLTQESEFSILQHQLEEILSPGIEVQANSIKIANQFTPQSASDAGEPGEIAWDSNYIYVCVAVDTWKRVALSTW